MDEDIWLSAVKRPIWLCKEPTMERKDTRGLVSLESQEKALAGGPCTAYERDVHSGATMCERGREPEEHKEIKREMRGGHCVQAQLKYISITLRTCVTDEEDGSTPDSCPHHSDLSDTCPGVSGRRPCSLPRHQEMFWVKGQLKTLQQTFVRFRPASGKRTPKAQQKDHLARRADEAKYLLKDAQTGFAPVDCPSYSH
ncbi:hypothetical protein FQN60_001477 [Etheostoma spectabile]|uniref:Uncharacterized protein n=1 Tax=Etheostoma spectabile TaxID=54343 RepID=A0A5J5D5E6_9PERO|nr:hypothetical protein FQN60_001477 [Etheostoma spectabile]